MKNKTKRVIMKIWLNLRRGRDPLDLDGLLVA